MGTHLIGPRAPFARRALGPRDRVMVLHHARRPPRLLEQRPQPPLRLRVRGAAQRVEGLGGGEGPVRALGEVLP